MDVDLLQAAGRDHEEAVGPLPRLS
jgi:hypothetical protein